MNLVRLSLKLILNQRRFAVLFILSLTVGLLGLSFVEIFKSSVSTAMHQRSLDILGADVSISLRGQLSESTIEAAKSQLPKGSQWAEIYELYSMVSSSTQTRLVMLRFFPDNFPFYGKMESKTPPLPPLSQNSNQRPTVWVYPELLAQLKLNVGDELKIGQLTTQITQEITKDTANVFGSAAFAPTVFVSIEQLKKTGLILPGSTFYHSLLIKLPSDSNVETIAKEIETTIKDNAVRVNTHKSAAEQVSRMLDYLSDYLGLTTLVALLLATLGALFLFRNYIYDSFDQIAILVSLGLSRNRAKGIFVIQIILLAIAAAFLTTLICMVSLPILQFLIDSYSPFPIVLKMTFFDILVVITVSTLASLLTCLPQLGHLEMFEVQQIFQGQYKDTNIPLKRLLIYYFPSAICFFIAAVGISNSYQVGGFFYLSLFAIAIVLGILFQSLIRLLIAFENSLSVIWKLVIRSYTRQKQTNATLFIVFCFAVVLVNFIPQLQHSINQEISSPYNQKVPDLFLFDIQEEQAQNLQDFTKNRGVAISDLSPLVRARLTKVNGMDFENASILDDSFSREQARENQFRNRGYNLTYRLNLHSSERMLQGTNWSQPFDQKTQKYPFISLEKRFAQRLNLKINDLLEFDVQGIAVEGKVTSIRQIQWTSFHPNFFIQFQPGVLEEAPKTYIASISSITKEQISGLQADMVAKFPNISIVDVRRLAQRISSVVSQMGITLSIMALLSTLVGLIVLASIIHHQFSVREKEIELFRLIGTPFPILSRLFFYEFCLSIFTACFFGMALASALSYVIVKYVFDGYFYFQWQAALTLTFGILVFSLLVAKYRIHVNLKKN